MYHLSPCKGNFKYFIIEYSKVCTFCSSAKHGICFLTTYIFLIVVIVHRKVCITFVVNIALITYIQIIVLLFNPFKAQPFLLFLPFLPFSFLSSKLLCIRKYL